MAPAPQPIPTPAILRFPTGIQAPASQGPRLPSPRSRRQLPLLASLLLAILLPRPAAAKIQFDVFIGYDSIIRSAAWFPVGIEVLNEGPSFDGVIEIASSQFGGQSQRYAVELPTGTRKRLVVPAFSPSGNFAQIDARLLDAAGKIREERPAQRPRISPWDNFMLGAMPAQYSGMPQFPEGKAGKNADFTAQVARMPPEFFPDNPILIEGLNALYLNSERALLLKEPQVDALLGWVRAGGHLVVAIEQPSDLNSAPWLRDTLPARVGEFATRKMNGELRRWLTRDDVDRPGQPRSHLRFGFEAPQSPPQPALEQHAADQVRTAAQSEAAFDRTDLPVVALKPDPRTVTYGATNMPLIVSGPRGRGLVTVLAFNPERDPVKSWKLRPWMWARLAGVPTELLLRENAVPGYGNRMLDSIFGSMIETRQIRRLPKEVLLLLLLVYLVVIGPFDQWWLKRINRPMLTWITFPAYVTLFSLLIWWIGFRLRAGQTEWNELHVTDVLPRSAGADLRSRTYASIYSPANAAYKLASDLRNATIRSELVNLWGGAGTEARTAVQLGAKQGFQAEVYVPVWTSQMLVSDWHDDRSTPVKALAAEARDGFSVRVENTGGKPFERLWVVHDGFIHDLGALPPGEPRSFSRQNNDGKPLQAWLDEFLGRFSTASVERQKMLGGNSGNHIDDWGPSSVAASFPGLLNRTSGEQREFVPTPASDLTPLFERGETLLFAWMPDELAAPALHRFTALKSRNGTLLRLVVPPAPATP